MSHGERKRKRGKRNGERRSSEACFVKAGLGACRDLRMKTLLDCWLLTSSSRLLYTRTKKVEGEIERERERERVRESEREKEREIERERES